MITTFEESGLSPEIQAAVAALGYVKPTEIQSHAIPAILASRQDLIALAQTGTGKTAAFGLPVIDQVDADLQHVQAIVLCPTRELANQITSDLVSFSTHTKGLKIAPVFGGAAINGQIQMLKRGAQIVVGTPGRIIDLINRKALNLNQVEWLILDEADEMLNMGFQQDIDTILATTPENKQTLLFSATMPSEIARISKKYMHDPKEITVGTRNSGATKVKHEYCVVSAKDRYEALKRIADLNPEIYSIVFCRTRRETQEVARKLMNDGYNADAIHGDLSQAQRDEVMAKFRANTIQMLVATDVAARGLDVNNISHVINYELPDDPEVYVHRSGRTGRADASGISICIVHSRETGKIKQLEKMTGKTFDRKKVPSGEEICEKQLFNLMDKMTQVNVDEKTIASYMDAVNEKFADMSREDLLKRFVSMEFNRFLDYYRNARDLNVESKPSRDRDDRSERSGRKSAGGKISFSGFQANIGAKDQLNPARLIGLINEQMRNRDMRIGKIDIESSNTYFEIESQYSDEIVKSFRGAYFEGSPVTVKPTGQLRSSSNERFGGGGGGRKRTGGGGRGGRKPAFNRSGGGGRRGGY